MRLLLDENLSPALANVISAAGHKATALRNLSRLGIEDREVVELALDRDAVIITNNASDFLALCRTVDAHPGLIVVESTARAPSQREIEMALSHIEKRAAELGLAPRTFMFNRVVEVTAALQCEDFELPAGEIS